MQNEQSANGQKKSSAKPLMVSLLCIGLVCLAAVLPGVLVGMNDEQLYDRFIPTGGAKITAGFAEDTLQRLEAIGAFRDGEPHVNGDEVQGGARVEECCGILLRQLGLLQGAGLLSAGEVESVSAMLDPAASGLAVAVSGDEEDARFAGISAAYGGDTVCELWYDTVNGRTLAVSLTLPVDEWALAPETVEAEAGLRAYIDWLGVSELSDWSVTRQEDGRSAAYSPTADLLLARQSATAPDGHYRVSYSIS